MTENYRVGVLGLGREGIDTLRFLRAAGIESVGLDSKPATEWPAGALRQLKQLAAELRLGRNYLAGIGELDIVFRSPGVPLDLPEIKKARRRGVVFSSLMQIFFELCPAQIIGVTGTKGKSTTVSLIHHLLKGRLPGKIYLGGNIGAPPLKLLSRLTKRDWVVLELSSFQLEDLAVSPTIAVMLDVSPEHLDRHKQSQRYLAAKTNIFAHQRKSDWLVASADHPVTRAALRKARGRTFTYSTGKVLSKGLYLVDGEVIYRHLKTGRRSVLLRKEQIPLLGHHNLENALAAIATALVAGMKPQMISKRISRFKPLKHRLELVGNLGRVQFVDDSLATTPIAAIAAIKTILDQLSVIIGGVSKRENLKELIKALDDNRILGIVLIGKSTPRLRRELKAAKIRTPYQSAKNLSAAVAKAYRYVKNEGTVLLAPAFASFDMFKDAYDRGDKFKQIVKELIKQKS
jgi:UDP-N-acetylmuramoylalanine--D-glutamate ligase